MEFQKRYFSKKLSFREVLAGRAEAIRIPALKRIFWRGKAGARITNAKYLPIVVKREDITR